MLAEVERPRQRDLVERLVVAAGAMAGLVLRRAHAERPRGHQHKVYPGTVAELARQADPGGVVALVASGCRCIERELRRGGRLRAGGREAEQECQYLSRAVCGCAVRAVDMSSPFLNRRIYGGARRW